MIFSRVDVAQRFLLDTWFKKIIGKREKRFDAMAIVVMFSLSQVDKGGPINTHWVLGFSQAF